MLMNFARIEAQVCIDEGYRAQPYLDSEGVPTIGYGTTRVLGVPVTLNDPAMTEAVARQILRQDLFVACMDAQALFPRLGEMNDCRQEVLVNMAYNMGRNRLEGFVDLISAAANLDYDRMAAEMKDSKWFGQVGRRSAALHAAMLTGSW